MPTIQEAAAQLRVSRPTLKKWMTYCGVEPKQHPLDKRFYVITDEQLQQIAEVLSERPGQKPVPRLTSQPAYQRNVFRHPQLPDSPESHYRASLVQQPSSGGLPDGWVSWRSFAAAHGIPASTVQKSIESGRLEVSRGRWKSGQAWVLGALDPQQQERFLELWPR